ncbi:uncharacterized protein LOC131681085 [Topomyia yanbarensis]|uniref:uncharacterized protein LOC131681085 n=1 Tax=Topomyia yanbarensis TaxID=2498891 RepID=UPI00273B9EB5|nr:uncharacterized protein LOC131681085 [Topomyia yanbarensis]
MYLLARRGFGQEQDNCQDGPPTNVTVKLPPLIVKSIPLEQLQKVLHAKGISAQFKLTRIGIKVMLQTMDEYLNQHKAQFFTDDMPSEKPFKAVVRGLPVMQPEDIKSELEERYKLQPLAVYVIARKKKENYEYRDCLYLVHFRKGTVTLGALKAAKFIGNVVVSWEPHRGIYKDVTQCMRCLHFGHGTRNCHPAVLLKEQCGINVLTVESIIVQWIEFVNHVKIIRKSGTKRQ